MGRFSTRTSFIQRPLPTTTEQWHKMNIADMQLANNGSGRLPQCKLPSTNEPWQSNITGECTEDDVALWVGGLEIIIFFWFYSMKIENSDLQLKYIPIHVFSWFPRHLQIFIQFYSDSKLHQGGDKESPAVDGGYWFYSTRDHRFNAQNLKYLH